MNPIIMRVVMILMVFAVGFSLGMYRKIIEANGARNDFEEKLLRFDNNRFNIVIVALIAVMAVLRMALKLAFGIVLPF